MSRNPLKRARQGAAAPIRRLLAAACLCLVAGAAHAQLRIVALGDSSFRGGPAMRDPQDSLPSRLEQALRLRGYDVTVANEGINGELSWQTRMRVDTAVPEGTPIVLLSAGSNDVARERASRTDVHSRLMAMVERLRARGIEVLVFNLGDPGGKLSHEVVAAETRDFQALGAVAVPPIQSGGLSTRNDLHVEPVWLPGTTLWHLNRQGNDIVVARILPQIEKMIARVKARQG